MNKIKDADFMTKFPPALKKDKSMLALGQLIAEELHITAHETKKNIIYANIEELSETWLDVLAYDLHVDWYDYDYLIEAKRVIIRDSIRVHQKLGTTGATERALGGLHPQSEIEEWYDYNGRPFHFRIVLDTTNSRVAVDYDEIVSTVDIYKRLTAHLDGLYYQCSMCIIIMPQTEYFLFQTPMTGQLRAGMYPHRNTEGVVLNAVIDIMTQAAGYIAESVPTGTRPYRNITFATKDSDIVTDSDTMGYKYIHGRTGKQKTGTEPYRDTAGGAAVETVVAQAAADAAKYDSDLTGTKPDRNIVHGRGDIEAVADTEFEEYRYITDATGKQKTGTEPYRDTAGGAAVETVVAQAAADAAKYDSDLTGTKPDRNIVHGRGDIEAVADTEFEEYRYITDATGKQKTGTEPYRDTAGGAAVETVAAQAAADAVKYDSDLTGTKPDRSKKQGISDKGMSTTADTESYQYEVKRCGRNRL